MDPTVIKQLGLQSCTVDNIRIMRGQVIRLQGIRAMIWANIREAERAKTSAALVNSVLFGLQMVKATCDVVIGVAGEWLPVATGVSTVYSGITPNAENVGKLASGQDIGWADFGKGGVAGLNAIVKQRLGVDSPLADFADLNKVKADIVINATAMDEQALVSSLVDYGVVLSSWAAKEAGRQSLGRAIKSVDEARKASLAYHAAYKEWRDGDMDGTFDAGIKMANQQLITITNKIQTLESHLSMCGDEMPKFQPSSIKLLTDNVTGPALRLGR
ncbi:hypothetical protein [Porphyrobacter sp. YT40]|uniref:hypothetical protein n=1 Tax=Porphyrobacter sp. YT40 TaxID=2547601 RepID=UPI0011433E12|nr:hypothetical protein [Porphyrobacter sp. YT40]QDH35025.1 hypothetical protein E2E27_12240 [Porphyrobacter sp. YT40]